MQTTDATLTRKQIREILADHRGAAARMAEEIGVSHCAVSLWLKGKSTSRKIAAAAQAKAQQLLLESSGGNHEAR